MFDADARAEKKSRVDYNTCEELTRATKRKLRESLVREILFAHDDATFLIGDHTVRGVAFSRSSAVLYFFDIGDAMVPKIEFVAHDASTASRVAAVTKFMRYFRDGHPFSFYVSEANRAERRAGNFRGLDVGHYSEKGYCISEPMDVSDFYGLTIRLNEKAVAKLSPWDDKTNGYLVRTMSESIMMESPSSTAAIHVLDISFVSGMYEVFESSFSIIYDARSNFDGPAGRERFQREFAGVAAFLSAIEPFIKQLSKSWDEDEVELARKTMEKRK